MKRILYIVSALLVLVSCTDNIFGELSGGRGASSDLKICAQIHPYSELGVDTKAGSSEENSISNMLMFITDNGGTIRDAQFISGSKFLFNVDRSHLSGTLTSSTIHIVANYSGLINVQDYIDRKAVSDIENLVFSVSGDDSMIDIPAVGIPMYGKKEGVNLDPDAILSDSDKIIRIELERLYSKVTFNIQVKPTQWFDDKIQSFVMDSWTVHNVPKYVTVKNLVEDTGTLGDSYIHTATVERFNSSRGDNTVYQSRPDNNSDVLSFSFYMPEHKTAHFRTVTYPWLNGVQESERDAVSEQYKNYRQYLKPEWVKETEGGTAQSPYATYVEIKGHYIDYNGASTEITYFVYPGANEYDDFNILRDKEYKNNIIIKGINNSMHATGSWVTYDHRVDVEQRDVVVNMQRETLLDCHWEIRPLRVTLNGDIPAETDVNIKLIDPSSGNPIDQNGLPWIRMEVPTASEISSNSSSYCDVGQSNIAYGKRRYFTTDLVSNTLKANVSKTIRKSAPVGTSEEHTVWVYVDEYVSKTDADATYSGSHPGYRNAILRCSYSYTDAGGNTRNVEQDFVFRQWNIFKVVDNDHSYYIEHYEEYLYNFDSKDQYVDSQGIPTTSDGMPWGMENVELSDKYPAAALDNVGGSGSNTLKNKVKTGLQRLPMKYDFYLQRDFDNNPEIPNTNLTKRNNGSGKVFTQEIAETVNLNGTPLPTNGTPGSAIEYALNKNKRNADGTISLSSIKWYLPAIDEIEEICKGGYNDFEVFQDKLYWSSQPSFIRGVMDLFDRAQNGYHVQFFKEDSGIGYLSPSISSSSVVLGTPSVIYGKGRARATKVNDRFENVKSESYGIQTAVHAAVTAPNSGDLQYLDIGFYYCYPGHPISFNERKNYQYRIIITLNSYHTYNLNYTWKDPTAAEYQNYLATGAVNSNKTSVTVNDGDPSSYQADWKYYYYFYDEGNCSRDEIHRVRCVYAAD